MEAERLGSLRIIQDHIAGQLRPSSLYRNLCTLEAMSGDGTRGREARKESSGQSLRSLQDHLCEGVMGDCLMAVDTPFLPSCTQCLPGLPELAHSGSCQHFPAMCSLCTAQNPLALLLPWGQRSRQPLESVWGYPESIA